MPFPYPTKDSFISIIYKELLPFHKENAENQIKIIGKKKKVGKHIQNATHTKRCSILLVIWKCKLKSPWIAIYDARMVNPKNMKAYVGEDEEL